MIRQRLDKRAKLLEKGIDPYGGFFEVSESVAAARTNPTTEREVHLAGRLMSHRDMGGSIFADIKDATGKIQIYVQKKALAELESKYTAKVAERELFLKGEIVKAIDKGDAEAVEQLEKQLLSDRKSLRAECEEKKEEVRNAGK